VTLTGNELPGVPRAAQHQSIVEGLKAAHDVVAPHGVTLIVEPLNTLVNHQGYYLNHTAEAFVLRSSRRSAYAEVDVWFAGKLAARATTTYMIKPLSEVKKD